MDLANCQPSKDFDLMLDIPSMKNLKRVRDQKRFLMEKDVLLQNMDDMIDHLKFKFRKDDVFRKEIDHH